MIGPGLKKFAKQNDLKIAHGVAYGNFHGYAATFCEGADWKRIVVDTRFTNPDKRDALRAAMARENLTTQYRVQFMDIRENGIVIWFLDRPGTMKKIEEFCQWFFPQLAEYEATGIDICSECGEPIGEDGCWKLLFEAAWHMHKECAEKVQARMDTDAAERLQADTGSYATGVIGALLGAVLGAVVWGVVLHMGFVASIVGFLIGFLAEKGYTILKGKQSKAKVFIIAGATIFGVLLGNIGYDAVMWAVEIAKYAPEAAIVLDGTERLVSYGDIPMLIGYFLVNDAEYCSATVLNCLMGIGFALLGVWGLLRKTKNETTDPKAINLE